MVDHGPHQPPRIAKPGQPLAVYRLGAEYDYFPASMKPTSACPGGHPEGFHEALANLHRYHGIPDPPRRGENCPEAFPLPDVEDGVAGMAFVEAAVAKLQRRRRVGRGPTPSI